MCERITMPNGSVAIVCARGSHRKKPIPAEDLQEIQSAKAELLLSGLRKRGFTVEESAGKVLITPSSKLTTIDVQAIRQHKPELLGLLALETWLPPAEWWTSPDDPVAVVIDDRVQVLPSRRWSTLLATISEHNVDAARRWKRREGANADAKTVRPSRGESPAFRRYAKTAEVSSQTQGGQEKAAAEQLVLF